MTRIDNGSHEPRHSPIGLAIATTMRFIAMTRIDNGSHEPRHSPIGLAIATTMRFIAMTRIDNGSHEPRHSPIGLAIATTMRFIMLMSACAVLLSHSVACHTPATSPYHEQLVVRAYLYAGKPVTDI